MRDQATRRTAAVVRTIVRTTVRTITRTITRTIAQTTVRAVLPAGTLLLAGAAGAQSSPDRPVARSFSDWSLTCDNLRSCVAMSADRDDGHLILIARDAGPDAAPTIELIGGALPVLEQGPGHGPVRYPAPAWATRQADLDIEILGTSQLPAAQAFVDAVRNADALRPADPADEASVSLKGLSAALLLMDEVQGRLGTRGALLRRGGTADSRVPPAPEPPLLMPAPLPAPLDDAAEAAIVAAVRNAQSGLLEAEGCDDSAQPDQAWALDEARALVYLGCVMGAYQGSGPLFIAQRTTPHAARRLVLDNPATGGSEEMLTSVEYNPATATLDHFGKGRGMGDCGESASWVFDGEHFRLARYAAMDRCAGLLADRWPVRWRTRVREAGR